MTSDQKILSLMSPKEIQILYHDVLKNGKGPLIVEDLKRRFFYNDSVFPADATGGIGYPVDINSVAINAAMAEVVKFIERQLRPIGNEVLEVPQKEEQDE